MHLDLLSFLVFNNREMFDTARYLKKKMTETGSLPCAIKGIFPLLEVDA